MFTREYIQGRIQILEGHRLHHLAQANAAVGAMAELKLVLDSFNVQQKEADPGSGVRDEADLLGSGTAEAD